MILIGHITPELMDRELQKLADKWHLTFEFLLKIVNRQFRITTRNEIKNICDTLGIKLTGGNINKAMKIFIWIKAMKSGGRGFLVSAIKSFQRDFKKYNNI